MNTFEHNPKEEALGALIKTAADVRLDDDAREQTRVVLSEYMKFKPVRFSTSQTTFSRLSSFFSRGLRIHPMPIVAAILVAIVGSSTVAAAESALPGDLLYDIKVSVNEPMRSVMITSGEAKAEWEIERAERRMEEAAVLALSGQLDDEKSAEIQERLESHVSAAVAEKVELEKNDYIAAARVETNLDAALIAHADVLSIVRDEVEDEISRSYIDSVIEHASSRTFASRNANEIAVMAMVVDTLPEDAERDEDIEKERSVAKARIVASERLVERNEKRIKEETRTKIRARLSGAKSEYEEAEQALSKGDKKGARSSFNRALHDAIQTRALLSVHANKSESKGSASATVTSDISTSAVMIEIPGSSDRGATISITADPETSISTTTKEESGPETEIEIEIHDEESSPGSGKGSIKIKFDD